MSIRNVIAAGLLSASALLVATPAAIAATATTSQAGSGVQILAGAPCIVTGYSLHAAEEMAKDSITGDQVEDVVYTTCSRAVKQTNGNWKYTKGKIVVICNNNGYVVTAWRRS
ncbi:DUF4258 domain-containing protein [Microbispora sp. H10670]|uniref:DUF4258 domain-containing protein n=1 Tax=Microbispora sp. H10670 TaxID=2729108 RepID=UPI001600F514|nr:DUF4258 domain-containing protein [Microbispora sp. H10670]